MRVVSQYIVTNNDAGPKAKTDIEEILRKSYNAKIFTNKVRNNEENNVKSKIKKFIFSTLSLKSEEMTIIQIPFSNKIKILNMAKNKIGLIHDIDGLRYNNEKLLKEEINALNQYQGIIVHNDAMEKVLKDNGLTTKTEKIELFDYLVDDNFFIKERKFNKNDIKIAYPGNLEPNKASFLYNLDENRMNFRLSIYGNYLEKDKLKNNKIVYKGSFPPNVIIERLEEDLGLVWSGKIDESDIENGEKRIY